MISQVYLIFPIDLRPCVHTAIRTPLDFPFFSFFFFSLALFLCSPPSLLFRRGSSFRSRTQLVDRTCFHHCWKKSNDSARFSTVWKIFVRIGIMKIRSVANDEHFTDCYYLSYVCLHIRACVCVCARASYNGGTHRFRRFTPIFSNNTAGSSEKLSFEGISLKIEFQKELTWNVDAAAEQGELVRYFVYSINFKNFRTSFDSVFFVEELNVSLVASRSDRRSWLVSASDLTDENKPAKFEKVFRIELIKSSHW